MTVSGLVLVLWVVILMVVLTAVYTSLSRLLLMVLELVLLSRLVTVTCSNLWWCMVWTVEMVLWGLLRCLVMAATLVWTLLIGWARLLFLLVRRRMARGVCSSRLIVHWSDVSIWVRPLVTVFLLWRVCRHYDAPFSVLDIRWNVSSLRLGRGLLVN